MTTAGEARMYLQGEAERDLNEAEIHIKLLAKEGVTEVLQKLSKNLYQLRRNLRRNKEIPVHITANIQVCYDETVELRDEAGRKIVSSLTMAGKEAVKRKLLVDLKKIRSKISTVESLLVQIEKEGQKNSQRMSA